MTNRMNDFGTWEYTEPFIDPTIIRITEVRAANNRLWMRLLDIAMKHAPDETKEVMRAINLNDRTISDLVGELAR